MTSALHPSSTFAAHLIVCELMRESRLDEEVYAAYKRDAQHNGESEQERTSERHVAATR